MSNQERAAEVILKAEYEHRGHTCDLYTDTHVYAKALDDAGLLATELPEPDYDTGSLIIWDHVCHSVTYNKFLGVSLIAEVNERRLPNDEAREIAYSLLAAAKLAEEQE